MSWSQKLTGYDSEFESRGVLYPHIWNNVGLILVNKMSICIAVYVERSIYIHSVGWKDLLGEADPCREIGLAQDVNCEQINIDTQVSDRQFLELNVVVAIA